MGIDPITLALAKPEEVDLTQFTDGTRTISDVVLSAITESLQSGGSLQEISGRFSGLRAALSTNREIVVRLVNDVGLVLKGSAFTASYDGMAMQCSLNGLVYNVGVIFNFNVIFVFENNPNETSDVTVWVKATPLNA